MKALVFQRNGVLLDGTYLPGVARYASAVRLLAAELTAVRRPPTAGVLRLELEVGGQLTGLAFTVSPASGEARQTLTLGATVPAQTIVRWRASFTGQPTEAASDVAITVSVGRVVPTQAILAQVNWSDGAARVPIASYSNGRYLALNSSRASVASDGSTIWLDGAVVLTAASDGLRVKSFREGALTGRPQTGGSWVEFWLQGVCVGALDASALRVRQLAEASLPGGEGFTFGTAAILGSGGLVATQLVEG